MSDTNKILTVSYGTFSCTLEGFDDPFGTMRGIAEYFRDLAAEDRYFGAEPPTPDVEMLQKIAQRNMQQRVEARIADSGVALRASETVEDAELSDAAQTPEKPEQTGAEAPVTTADAGAPTKAAPEPMTEAAPAVSDEVSPTAPLAFDDEYLMSDEPEDAFQIDANAPAAPTHPPESIAEKLRRIRAVVSRNIEPAASGKPPFTFDDSDESSIFESPGPKRDRALSETIRSITADIADDDGDGDDYDDGHADAAGDSLFAETDEAPDEGASEADVWMSDDVPQAEDASDEPEPVETGHDEKSEDMIADVMAATAKEADVEIESDEDDGPDETGNAIAPDTDNADVTASDEDSEAAHEPALEPLSESNSDVGRLLKETDEKFADGEGIRRRRVISQMRAAVAATKAERVFSKIVPPDEQERVEQSPYRRDLDATLPGTPPQVQRGAAPEVAEAPKTVAPKSAPLVLVSSQRVDQAPESDAEASDFEESDIKVREGDGFADFAEKMGAEELPDLLEAAAAYSAFVEGQPHFSRPEIMKRVARIDPVLSLSREAGLRSFGLLLRQGKIHKLQRGQFAIAEDTRFNPSQRIAG